MSMRRKKIKLVFDEETIRQYEQYYFQQHPRAHRKPISHPYHESINQWMIMKRPMMNALKQKWKDFIVWFVNNQGLSDLRIDQCELKFTVYYATHRPHDVDNSCPKFIIDGLVVAGLIQDDNSDHIKQLILLCDVDTERPRTEIEITIIKGENDEKI